MTKIVTVLVALLVISGCQTRFPSYLDIDWNDSHEPGPDEREFWYHKCTGVSKYDRETEVPYEIRLACIKAVLGT